MRVLVVTAVAAERNAVAAGLPGTAHRRRHRHDELYTVPTAAAMVDLAAGGVGPAAAAAATGRLLGIAEHEGAPYSAVVVLGLAGGFPGRARVGDVVVASTVIDADLGCRTAEGHLTPAEMGLPAQVRWDPVSPPPAALARRLTAGGLAACTGTVLTVTTMTGTDERAAELSQRYEATAEAMEGAGALVATLGLPEVGFAEVRVVVNTVGRREPAAWDVPAALRRLTAVAAALLTGPLPR